MSPTDKAYEKASSNEQNVSTLPKNSEEKKKALSILDTLKEKKSKYGKVDILEHLCIPPPPDSCFSQKEEDNQYLISTLTRFLRARKGSVEIASSMIEEAIDFRIKYDVANIFKKPLTKEVVTHLRKGFYEGVLPTFDKHGRPVYMLQGGKSNKAIGTLTSPPESFGKNEWDYDTLEDMTIHHHLIFLEYLTRVIMKKATDEAGHIINKYIVIDDLKGFSMTGLKNVYKIMAVFKKMAFIDQLLYPETMAILYFTNSPALFRGPWSIIKKFLDAETVNKMFVLAGEKQYQPCLDALFDKKSLPVFLGGELKGNHVTSYENPETQMYQAMDQFVNKQTIDKSFNVKRSAPYKEVSVGARKTETVTIQAKKGDVVEFQVIVKSNDVMLSAEFEDSVTEVSSNVLSETKISHDEGIRLESRLLALNDGCFKLNIANSHSKFRSKTAYYRIYSYNSSL